MKNQFVSVALFVVAEVELFWFAFFAQSPSGSVLAAVWPGAPLWLYWIVPLVGLAFIVRQASQSGSTLRGLSSVWRATRHRGPELKPEASTGSGQSSDLRAVVGGSILAVLILAAFYLAPSSAAAAKTLPFLAGLTATVALITAPIVANVPLVLARETGGKGEGRQIGTVVLTPADKGIYDVRAYFVFERATGGEWSLRPPEAGIFIKNYGTFACFLPRMRILAEIELPSVRFGFFVAEGLSIVVESGDHTHFTGMTKRLQAMCDCALENGWLAFGGYAQRYQSQLATLMMSELVKGSAGDLTASFQSLRSLLMGATADPEMVLQCVGKLMASRLAFQNLTITHMIEPRFLSSYLEGKTETSMGNIINIRFGAQRVAFDRTNADWRETLNEFFNYAEACMRNSAIGLATRQRLRADALALMKINGDLPGLEKMEDGLAAREMRPLNILRRPAYEVDVDKSAESELDPSA